MQSPLISGKLFKMRKIRTRVMVMQICILSNITYGYRLLKIMRLLLIEQKIFANRNTMWYISFRPNLRNHTDEETIRRANMATSSSRSINQRPRAPSPPRSVIDNERGDNFSRLRQQQQSIQQQR